MTDLKWSPDAKFILQTSEDKEVKLFDARDLSGKWHESDRFLLNGYGKVEAEEEEEEKD